MRFSHMMLGLCLAALAQQSAVAEEDGQFHPSACTEDAGGRVWLRLWSGYHFAIPLDRFPDGRVHVDRDDPTGLPRNTAEPLGCPDNPHPTRGFDFYLRQDAPWYRQSWPPTVIGVSYVPVPSNATNVRHWLLKGDGRSLRMHVTPEVEVHYSSILPDGTSRNWRRTHESAVMIKLDPEQLRTAEGDPVVLRCLYSIVPDGRRACRGTYSVAEGLRVSFKFRTPKVMVFEAFAFNRAILADLASLLVTEEDCARLDICGPKRWQF